MVEDLAWDRALAPADPRVIARIEKRLSVKLPADYVACALKNHGGRPSRGCLDFGGRKDRVFRSLLPLVSDGKRMTLLEAYDAIKDRLPPRVFPFANQPAGDFFCFDYRGGKEPTVAYWNHEGAAAGPGEAMTPVADSFSAMLSMLHP